MARLIKNQFGNFLLISVIFLFVFAWWFASYPKIFQRPSIPPKIYEASASPDKKLEQQINIVDQIATTTATSYNFTDKRLGIVQLNPDKYTGATLYFEAVTITATGTAKRTRSNALSMPAVATQYTVFFSATSNQGCAGATVEAAVELYDITSSASTTEVFNNDCGAAASVVYLYAARLIIVQSDASNLLKTETQIELGAYATTSATAETTLTDTKIYYYDSSKFDPAPGTTTFEATFRVILGYNATTATASTTPTSVLQDTSSGTKTWLSMSNAKLSDNVFATTTLDDNEQSYWLVATGFGYSIPTGSRIDGIRVEFERKATVTTRIYDRAVCLVKDQVIITSVNRSATTVWTASDVKMGFATTATDLWSTSWTAENINSANFGFAIRASKNSTTGYYITGSVDYMATRIYYAERSTATATVVLYNITDNATVTSSNVSVTASTWARVRSPAITLTTGKEYAVRIKVQDSGSTSYTEISNAKLIFEQSSATGIDDVELIHQFVNAATNTTSTAYASTSYLNYFDKDNATGSATTTYAAYFEATVKGSAGTGAVWTNPTSSTGVGDVIDELLFDPDQRIIYAGVTGPNSGTYRCNASTTDCSSASNWTFTQPASNNYAMGYDSDDKRMWFSEAGDMLYCNTSSGCDAPADWNYVSTTKNNTSAGTAWAYDTANGILYNGLSWGDSAGYIVRCDASSTGCTSAGNWITATDTPYAYINDLYFDSVNEVMYAAAADLDVILRCDAAANDCMGTGNDWIVATTMPGDVYALAMDTTHNYMYACDYNTNVIKCDTTSGCDTASDWSNATSWSNSACYDLKFDSYTGYMYAADGDGGTNEGYIFKCDTSTGCDSNDWTLATNTPDITVDSLAYDSYRHTMYGGSYDDRAIYRYQDPDPATGYAQLSGIGEVSTNSSSYARRRSSDIWSSLVDNTEYTTQMKSSNITVPIYVSNSWLIIQVTGLYSSAAVQTVSCTTALTTSEFGVVDNNGVYTSSPNATTLISSTNGGFYIQVSDKGDTIATSTWTTATSHAGPAVVYDMLFEPDKKIIYATHENGVTGILRCNASTTDCAHSADWTDIAIAQDIRSLSYDSVNKAIFLGGEVGTIYRCETSSGCDATGDFSSVTTSVSANPWYAMEYDSLNGILYAGASGANYGDGLIVRCDASSTGCDAASEWSYATITTAKEVRAFLFDAENEVMYAGVFYTSGSTNDLYRCDAAANDCMGTGNDWKLVDNTYGNALQAFTMDTTNNAIYTINSTRNVYKCSTSDGCETDTDWSVVTSSATGVGFSMAYDSYTDTVYFGESNPYPNTAIIYQCSGSSGCDAASEWTLATTTNDLYAYSMTYDSYNHVVYAGTYDDGSIFRYKAASQTGGGHPGLFKDPDLIESPSSTFCATSTLAAGTEGYGLIATSTAANITMEPRYLWPTTGNTVGGITASSTWKTVASSTVAVTNETVTTILKAASAYETVNGVYNDTIYLQCFVEP